jgi:membrane-associated phospholipid phosphatase
MLKHTHLESSEDQALKNSEQNKSLPSTSRRHFLGRASGVTAATLIGLPLLAESGRAAEIGPLNEQQRRERAFQIRLVCAQNQRDQPLPSHPTNGDEELYPNKFASFSKALPHNNLGEVIPNTYQSLLTAMSSGRPEDFEAITLGGPTKLVDPQSALAYELEGADTHHLALPAPPAFSSEEMAGEMVELYWRALTRDVAFSQYGNESLTSAAVTDLTRFARYSGLSAGTLFRGGLPGEENGPFISQFLWKPFTFSSTPINQLYRTPTAGDDHMTSYQSWLNIQNGAAPATANTFDATPRYLRNGRDLGEYVHRDFSYQAFLNAALILLSFGPAAIDDANPYKSSVTQAGFSTFGGPHILSLLAQAANAALKAAWYQKWSVHRRIRPEEYAGRVHNHVNNAATYPLDAKLLNSAALAAVQSKNSTAMLPMAYPEGCPIHPAYPGGHATIAGACVTVLKAFFKETFIIPNPVVASDDGLTLQPFSGPTLTVGGELNKLASNMAYGRDTAGMHWRSDEVAGLRLGEAVAIAILTDQNLTFNESFAGFSLTKFDGTTLRLMDRPGRSPRGVVAQSPFISRRVTRP